MSKRARVASNGIALLICAPCLDEDEYPDLYNKPKSYATLDDKQAVTIKDGQALCIVHYDLTRKKSVTWTNSD